MYGLESEDELHVLNPLSAVTADAEYRKTVKYGHLSSTHWFVIIGVETLGVFGKEARCFFKEVAHRIEKGSDDHVAF